MTRFELKQKLLALDIVIENEYFDKYLDLIISNLDRKREKFKTQKHHIIPRSYYASKKIPLVNEDNIVNLLHADHLLAHYYLYRCAFNDYFRYCNSYAVLYMLNSKMIPETDLEVVAAAINYGEIYSDWCLLQSARYKGKPGKCKGKKASEATRRKLSESHKGIKQSAEANLKRSESLKKAYAEGRKRKDTLPEARKKISDTLTGGKRMHKEDIDIYVHKEDIDQKLAEGWEFGNARSEKRIEQFNRQAERYKNLGYKGKLKRLTNGEINRSTCDPNLVNQLLAEGYWFGLTKAKPKSSPHPKYKCLYDLAGNKKRAYSLEQEKELLNNGYSYQNPAKIIPAKSPRVYPKDNWTKEEVELLIQNYNSYTHIENLLKIFPEKTTHDIHQKAKEVGLIKTQNRYHFICQENQKEYFSLQSAADELNLDPQAIRLCLEGKHKYTGRFKNRYTFKLIEN